MAASLKLNEARMVFLDVETTGLSPAMGDRIVEVGLIRCEHGRVSEKFSTLIDPCREIPEDAREIHSISNADVADSPPFASVAKQVAQILDGAWVVGHNVGFDAGFLGMELMLVGLYPEPAGCLDTCQLANSLLDLDDNKLPTVAAALDIQSSRRHRALDDAEVCRQILCRLVDELGGPDRIRIEELQALHRWQPIWPDDPRRKLSPPIYDALTNGQEIEISYFNGNAEMSRRSIRPVACFSIGRNMYLKAHCSKAKDLRIFRLDRIVSLRAIQKESGHIRWRHRRKIIDSLLAAEAALRTALRETDQAVQESWQQVYTEDPDKARSPEALDIEYPAFADAWDRKDQVCKFQEELERIHQALIALREDEPLTGDSKSTD